MTEEKKSEVKESESQKRGREKLESKEIAERERVCLVTQKLQ